MVIGLILLTLVAVLIIFGLADRFLKNIGLPSWLAFILIMALVVCAVIPSITIGTTFSINLSGFLIPIIVVIVLINILGKNQDLIRAILGMLAVAGVTIVIRILIIPINSEMILTTSIIVGFVGGAVAYLCCMKRINTLIASIAGIVLGDLVVNLIARFFFENESIALGSDGVFNSVILAAVFGVLLVEIILAIKKAMNRKVVSSENLNMESSEDIVITQTNMDTSNNINIDVDNKEFASYFEDEFDQ